MCNHLQAIYWSIQNRLDLFLSMRGFGHRRKFAINIEGNKKISCQQSAWSYKILENFTKLIKKLNQIIIAPPLPYKHILTQM